MNKDMFLIPSISDMRQTQHQPTHLQMKPVGHQNSLSISKNNSAPLVFATFVIETDFWQVLSDFSDHFMF